MTELVLGTVQFGLNYGVTNQNGEISTSSMEEILEIAYKRGINLFDTAADYGNSQIRLGQATQFDVKRKYVTKFSLPTDGSSPTEMNVYGQSMQDLNVTSLHGVLFHKQENLIDPRSEATIEILREGRRSGLINKIGASIYNLPELRQALAAFPDLDILQLPSNLLDNTLLQSEEVIELQSSGVEIHVRSVFLQGLFLADPDVLPLYFEELRPALVRLREIASNSNLSLLQLILGKMRQNPTVDAVIVGATDWNELDQVSNAWCYNDEMPEFELPKVSPRLLDPRNWPNIRMNK